MNLIEIVSLIILLFGWAVFLINVSFYNIISLYVVFVVSVIISVLLLWISDNNANRR